MNDKAPAQEAVSPSVPFWTSPYAVGVVVALLVAAKLAVGAATDLLGDEAYYTLWAFYPLQAGYYDHPPAVAWFIAAGQALLGETALASRIVAILSSIVCALAVWRTGIALFADRTIAALATLWFSLSLGMAVGLLVVTPDAPSTLFWTLAVWAAAELHRSRNANWWLVFGLFAGLGLDAKYTGLFLGAGIVLWLVSYGETRVWFRSWQLYAGGALALVLFWPVIDWNIGHDFASLQFQLGRSAEAAPGLASAARFFPEYVGALALMLWPGVFLFVAVGLFVFLRRSETRRNPALGLLVLTAAPALVYFAWHSTHSRVQGNWILPLFASLALIGAWASVRWSPGGGPARAFYLWLRRWTAPLALLLVAAVYAQASFAPLPLEARLPTDAMAGWADVADEMAAVSRETEAAAIFARDYVFVAQLDCYARFGGHDLTVLPGGGFHHFTFVDPPGPDDVGRPLLFVSRAPVGSEIPETHRVLDIDGRYVSSVMRNGPGGRPAERIDFYLAGG